jgi:predicted TIM-barrel fold metal-dependent hydrolase
MELYRNPPKYLDGYKALYMKQMEDLLKHMRTSVGEFLNYLDTLGVTKAVIKAKDIETTYRRKLPNETVAELVRQYPDRLIGFAGVDPYKGMEAVRELEYAVRDLGLRGLAMEPFEYHLPANDRRFYPLYCKCVELDIPVNLHCSINFSTVSRMEYGRPLHLDDVAVDFPELKVVAMTPGWPWVGELVGVAWRHPNVYIETAAIRPKYMGMPNTGWSELLHYGNTVLQDKILFASSWPLLPIERTIREIRELPLKEVVVEKWLYRNAARLLALEL